MTTRKRVAPPVRAAVALAWIALFLGGCATPGPLHVYTLKVADAEGSIVDNDTHRTIETPAFLEEGDEVFGLAYDPFTDHFFLRLSPGNWIRVIDRPARAIKREFKVDDSTGSSGDLTVRPRDGHLYLLAGKDVVETTRLGKNLRRFPLTGIDASPIGIALDPTNDRLFILEADGRQITTHDLQGAKLDTFQLAEAAGASLAFDHEKRELYAPLRQRPGIVGIFDEHGALLRTLPLASSFVDVGPRSFVRVF